MEPCRAPAGRRVPADSWLEGETPVHAQRCPAVLNGAMSTPISATIRRFGVRGEGVEHHVDLEGLREVQVDPAEERRTSLAVWRLRVWWSTSPVATLSTANRSTGPLPLVVVRHRLGPGQPAVVRI